MKSLTLSLLVTAGLILGLWLVGKAAGFEVSLMWSLALSVALTLGLHLLFSSRARRS